MGKDLERRPANPDRPDVPSEFRAAVLEAVKLLRDALPPGVEMRLTATDNSTPYFREEDDVAELIPGPLTFELEVQATQPGISDELGPFWREAVVQARVIDRDGELDLVVVGYHPTITVPWG